jgi:hypothetical protein
MNLSKVFALSLLLVCSLAHARIQFHVQAELKNSLRYGYHRADVTFEVDVHEVLEIYNRDNVRVTAELLAERETVAVICFAIYAKNDAGKFEMIAAPVIAPNYTEPATISLGSSDSEIFTLSVQAQKVSTYFLLSDSNKQLI